MFDERMTQLSQIHNGVRDVEYNADILLELAQAFLTTGNERMYQDLTDIAHDLRNSAKSINEAIGARTMTDLNESRKMTGAIINAALAGALGQDR